MNADSINWMVYHINSLRRLKCSGEQMNAIRGHTRTHNGTGKGTRTHIHTYLPYFKSTDTSHWTCAAKSADSKTQLRTHFWTGLTELILISSSFVSSLFCFALFCFRTQQNSNETKIQTTKPFFPVFLPLKKRWFSNYEWNSLFSRLTLILQRERHGERKRESTKRENRRWVRAQASTPKQKVINHRHINVSIFIRCLFMCC